MFTLQYFFFPYYYLMCFLERQAISALVKTFTQCPIPEDFFSLFLSFTITTTDSPNSERFKLCYV